MSNRKYWLVSASVLLGLVCGSGMVHADANNASSNQSVPANVTNVVTTQSSSDSAAPTANVTATQDDQTTTSANTNVQSSSITTTASAQTESQNAAYYGTGWHNDGTGRTYTKADGTQAENEWVLIDGSWYYFDGTDLATNGWTGTNWRGDYKYYYFDVNGHYETSCWHSIYHKYSDTTTWTYSKADGTRAENEWLWINGSWYYFDGSDLANDGWTGTNWRGNYKYYYFDANGHYETNCWHSTYDKWNDVTTWTYSKADGTRAEDEWLPINGSWYYFDGDTLATNGWHGTWWNGQYVRYYFDANGHYSY